MLHVSYANNFLYSIRKKISINEIGIDIFGNVLQKK